jgi:prolyl-tRNA synthetase
MIARRDNREKAAVPMEGLAARLKELLDDVQRSLLAKALAFRDEHTQRASSYEEFKAIMDGRPGFVIASWCGVADCEAQIKTETQATIRNVPIDGDAPSGTCVHCDRPAVAEAWFAKSY